MYQPTDRDVFISRAIARLRKCHESRFVAPWLGRPMRWSEYIQLIAHITSEHSEGEERHVTT